MKKQGHVNIARHTIGDRKPVVMFLGVGAVLTGLTGCDSNEGDYYAFSTMGKCENTLAGQCQEAYSLAEKEAKRTAHKYMVESECARDFGADMCTEHEGIYVPRFAGFITHKSPSNNFTQPFFTSLNAQSSMFGLAFLADGTSIARYKEVDGLNVNLGNHYSKPLPTSKLEQLSSTSGMADNDTKHTSPSNSGGSGALNTLATAYIVSELIDEGGDYLSERERTKRYQQCIQSGQTDCSSYRVSSGTARVGTINSTSSYKCRSKLEKQAKNNYRSTPKVSTKCKGGFGGSGRAFGGFGS